jgi:hypothetical protein
VREAAGLKSALDCELWAALLLGSFWKQRFALALDDPSLDYAVALGDPLINAVARLGGPGARIALTAIERVDDGELGMRAGVLATEMSENVDALPRWLVDVGEAQISGAAVMRDPVFDDGVTVFLEARHGDGERHAVGVYIDNNLGVLANDIMLADSIEDVERVMREHPADDGELSLDAIAPGVAAGRIHAAMELTDTTFGVAVGEDYARLRAVALMRADETRGYVAVGERAEVTQHTRDRLRDEFLSSPEGAAFAPDSDEAFIAMLAIDFSADYADGQLLRWSPVLVELFMVGWIPRKVMAAAELFRSVPVALEAWVRFTARKTAKPAWATEATIEAINRWQDELIRAIGDPATPSPAMQLLTAARHAGVDLSDEESLDAFIATWNTAADER